MISATKRHLHKSILMVILIIGIAFLNAPKKEAQAFSCVCCCLCLPVAYAYSRAILELAHQATQQAFSLRMELHEVFLEEVLFLQALVPAWQNMNEQLVTNMMHQMFIVGTFFDAKIQMDTQRLLQRKTARAHKDYSPSLQMCEFTTNSRSLATSGMNSTLAANTISRQFEDRLMNKEGQNSALGRAYDRYGGSSNITGRLQSFTDRFCDYRDMNHIIGTPNTGFAFFCDTALNPRANMDIDFTRTIMMPRTIDVDMALGETFGNPEIFEMSNYLYAPNSFEQVDGSVLTRKQSHDEYMDMRAAIAKTSVAQNSFSNIVGYKARGSIDEAPYADHPVNPRGFSTTSYPYVQKVLEQLGMEPDEAGMYLGVSSDRQELSYYAQMEILAKKLYQRPEFYTNLYDKPANVKRTLVSMQAIDLMLDRDIYDSQIRSEAILSLILEAQVMKIQKDVADKVRDIQPR